MHFHASYDSLSCRRRLFIFYRKFYTPCKNIHIDHAAVVEEYCRLKANMRRMTSLHPCNVERDARVKNVARWHAVFLLMVRHRCQCRFVKYLMKVIAFFDSYKQTILFGLTPVKASSILEIWLSQLSRKEGGGMLNA